MGFFLATDGVFFVSRRGSVSCRPALSHRVSLPLLLLVGHVLALCARVTSPGAPFGQAIVVLEEAGTGHPVLDHTRVPDEGREHGPDGLGHTGTHRLNRRTLRRLAGLTGGGAGTALAAVLGQSLLSPVLGTFTDAFNQSLQFALYPTYVTPAVDDNGERVSGRVPPQMAVLTDFGVNIMDRFDLSILAAPNRNDIPPQGSLSYQIDQNLSISG